MALVERSGGDDAPQLAGVLAALDAHHHHVGSRAAEVVDGHSGDQRFFMAYGQAYGNPQAPGSCCAAIVRYIDAWYDAFDVRPGQALYPEPAARVRIW